MSRKVSQGSEAPTRLVYAVTHVVTARVFLRGQLAYMRNEGFDVAVVAGDETGELAEVGRREGVAVRPIRIAREMRPRDDAASLVAMTRALRDLRPDIVNASTPKAGLLGMIAARALGVRARVYLMRGLRLETETGLKRRILGATEHVAIGCASDVVCVSKSLRDTVVAGRYVRSAKAHVLGEGASNGVDAERFAPTPDRIAEGRAVRRELGIPEDAPVVGFIGRLVGDKGIAELARAMDRVREALPKARLLLVGADFAGDDVDPIATRLRDAPWVSVVRHVSEPAPYFQAMDVLAFPSKREGFPNVPLEAAASGRPVVGFRATGTIDCVVSGVTGELVAMGDAAGLARELLAYLRDPDRARVHGAAGRARVLASFTHAKVWAAWAAYYRSLAGA